MASYVPHSFAFGQGSAARAPLPADVRLMQATANTLLLVAGVAVCVAAVAWALRLPAFALRAIRIDGEVARNSETTIRANAAPKLAGNFVTLDLQKARAAFESVPWVRHAMVRRVWPMRLAVDLEEHKPAALWAAADGNDRLVNSFGEVFEANIGDVEDDRLPRLQGPEGSAALMLAMYQRLVPLIAPLQAGDLAGLHLSPRGSWRLSLGKGATVELGRGSDDEVLARTQHFVRTLPQVVAAYQRPLESADLRHVGGFAVKLRGVTTQLSAPPVRKK
ncbi:cell division protein FtsQ/DivIB [Aquabacterium sp. OR-4]|uniref:cell division protein FtsQ/DivIB n=1 Tax=Aquabacterium sp. OR-4 TaxID=2978127 RepID=UPI0021B24747|nr:cell division protein FtsQ/DivIB [Aquabacterium sp. OR-4]MDT7837215.1 cell division protein FtsQ/DivIB [Aquabacterium sp. OR-4]